MAKLILSSNEAREKIMAGVDKLANRGSLQAVPILTNAQDFMVNLRRNLI